MAIRLSQINSQNLYLSSGLPTLTGTFTVCGWFYISESTANWSVSFVIKGGDTDPSPQICTYGTGVNWTLGSDTGNSAQFTATVGTWHHLTWVHRSNSDNELWGDGTLAVDNYSITIDGTYTDLIVGAYQLTSNSYGYNGRIAYLKFWETALSESEILAEVYSVRPRRTANLYSFWPLLPPSTECVRDYSGNGHHLTQNTNAVTHEDPPPVSWGNLPVFLPWVATSGDYTADKSDTIAVAESFGLLDILNISNQR